MNPAIEIFRRPRTAGLALTRAAALLLVGGLVWGCATPAAAAVGVAKSNATRAPGSAEGATAAAASIDAFGLDLYRSVGAQGDNFVFSPTSITLALSMARAGAVGETGSQMDSVMHSAAGAANGNGMNSLDQALASDSGKFTDAWRKPVELKLNIANAPFAQSGMHLEKPYLDTLAGEYGAGLRLVDYRKDAPGAVKQINAWVSDQTEKRIPHLLDSLDPSTRLVLVNAIYLEAPWATPFPAVTQNAPFTTISGSQVNVPTMNNMFKTAYASGTGWQAVELPYVGDSLAMTIIVPDDLASFEKGLNATTYDQIVGALSPMEVDLTMPRFKTETALDLADALSAMGMGDAFDPDKADFSGITTDEPLYISKVVHQANIDVDEAGTTASAATAVVMAGGMPANIVEMQVNRPFIFAVRDTKTGAILFLGRIGDPSK